MKRTFFLIFLLTLTTVITIAQTSTPQSSENQTANSAAIKQQIETAQREEARRMQSIKQATIGSIDLQNKAEKELDSKKISCSQCPKGSKNLKVSKETAQLITPNKEDLAKYKQFLKQKNTGIVRLMSDKGCGENPLIIKSQENCASLTEIPGFGSSFSFRTERYVLGRFADVVYKDKKLYLFGNLTLGFMFNIGNKVIERVSSETKGMNILYNYEPPTNLQDLEKENRIVTSGLMVNNIEYKKSFELETGQTFGLRSIAFKLKKVWTENGWRNFDNSRYDLRKDVIIVVQVIRIEENSLTLIWKELQRKEAPEIVLSENEENELTGRNK